MFRSKPHWCAFGIAALLALAACEGGGDPVASHYSDALYQGLQLPGSGSPLTMDAGDVPFSNGQTNQILNMVAIPLGAFQGVDMSSLKELRMNLPAPSGKVALADVQFQQMDR
ncbi:MAG: hypothetical protein LBJ15_15490 [Comamonas sp.]|jgi:hypothetical protein|uniref:hypothetical protein n=1 Tax=Comamonas sp. TaxID=34028 RepID=UPI00281B53B5|nr:hypothetical protein [Comamonas sp.]MDR0215395.1 hypothetical protein [Comamonas sp.]